MTWKAHDNLISCNAGVNLLSKAQQNTNIYKERFKLIILPC